jgi:hypothetical protein
MLFNVVINYIFHLVPFDGGGGGNASQFGLKWLRIADVPLQLVMSVLATKI